MSRTYQCQTDCQERRQSSSNYTGGIGADALANVKTTFWILFIGAQKELKNIKGKNKKNFKRIYYVNGPIAD